MSVAFRWCEPNCRRRRRSAHARTHAPVLKLCRFLVAALAAVSMLIFQQRTHSPKARRSQVPLVAWLGRIAYLSSARSLPMR
jgi:hypothetical protein